MYQQLPSAFQGGTEFPCQQHVFALFSTIVLYCVLVQAPADPDCRASSMGPEDTEEVDLSTHSVQVPHTLPY